MAKKNRRVTWADEEKLHQDWCEEEVEREWSDNDANHWVYEDIEPERWSEDKKIEEVHWTEDGIEHVSWTDEDVKQEEYSSSDKIRWAESEINDQQWTDEEAVYDANRKRGRKKK